MHLVIYFCGTGNPGDSFSDEKQYLINPNIRTIFVKGCDTPEVCGAAISPNLKAFAQRFVNTLFKTIDEREDNILGLHIDRLKSIGVSLRNSSENLSDINESNPVESITLCGYSRGAVTCFEVAKQLYKIAPDIPIDIVADQPVPGNCYQFPRTNAFRIADCSDLKNLKNVSIILAAYTGSFYGSDNTRLITFMHRTFFSQVVTKLPRTTYRDLIVIPRESHHQDLANSPDGSNHMHMQIAIYLNKRNLISNSIVEERTEIARASYTQHQNSRAKLFPQQTKLQGFFGMNSKKSYQYLDPLHPCPGLRQGYTFETGETLLDWWNKHDKNASLFSSELTRKLVGSIKRTDANDVEALKSLFSEADNWLLLKGNVSSSRYYHVEALRNNIYYQLIHQMNVIKLDLGHLKRDNLQRTNYFLNRWHSVSNASYFKTDLTYELESAFTEHATTNPSLENDQKLLTALNTWIENKKESRSKRWEDIIEIRRHLSGVCK